MKLNIKKKIRFIISLLIGIVLLYFTFKLISFNDLLISIQKANWLYIIFALLIFLAALIINSFRLQEILSINDSNNSNKLSIFFLFSIINITTMFNNILPARLGEVVKGYILVKKKKINWTKAASFILIERLLDIIPVLIFIIFPFCINENYNNLSKKFSEVIVQLLNILTFSHSFLTELLKSFKEISFFEFLVLPFLIMTGILFFCIMLLFIFRNHNYIIIKLFKNMIFFLKKNHIFFEKLEHFLSTLKFINDLKKTSKIIMLSFSIWIFYGFSFYFFIIAFNINLTWYSAFFINGTVALSLSIPLTPGGIGYYEFIFIIASGLMIINDNFTTQLTSIISCALILHLSQMILVNILGITFFCSQKYLKINNA